MVRYIIHAERLWNDKDWDSLVRLLRKKGRKCHVFLMPPQYTYQYANMGFRGTKEELSKLLTQRYTILAKAQKKYGYKVGIHMHFAVITKELSEEERMQGIKYGYKWINKFFQHDIIDFSFGWFKYDEYMAEICIRNGLNIINDRIGHITIHDYDLPMTSYKIAEKKFRVYLRLIRRFFRRFFFTGNRRLGKLKKQLERERKKQWQRQRRRKKSSV
jgi:hypothetical protein